MPRAPRNRSPRTLGDPAAPEAPIVTDDWPAELPILDAELELLRAEALDILAALLDHNLD